MEAEDQTILKYIHKKFRPLHSMQPPPSGGDRGDISASAVIRRVTIRTSQPMEASFESSFEASMEASFEGSLEANCEANLEASFGDRLEASLEDILEDSFVDSFEARQGANLEASLENRSKVQQRKSVIVRRQEQEQPLDTTIDIEFEVRHHLVNLS